MQYFLLKPILVDKLPVVNINNVSFIHSFIHSVRLELARLVSSLLYGTRAMLVLNLSAFENKTLKNSS